MFSSELVNEERCAVSVAKAARSARRMAGLEAMVPRSTMRRPAWSVCGW